MKVAIRQIRGNSGIDVWAQQLCQGIRSAGHVCSLDLKPPIFQFFPHLAPLCRNPEQSDIIQGNTWDGFAFGGPAPLVISAHHVVFDPVFDPFKSRAQRIFHRLVQRYERRSLDNADSVIAVSQYTQKRLMEVYGYAGARVIYNGIDTDLFHPTSLHSGKEGREGNRTILFFAGNLSSRKGGDLLPGIMKELGDDFLLLLATGARGTAISGVRNIRNLGNVSQEQLVGIYNECDIFLSPTRLEGFGLSIAEAMACGKPVVATNCSAVPELVVNGKGGFLCEKENIQEFVDRIRYLSAEPEEIRKMGSFNRERAESSFSAVRMTSEYLKCYARLVI